MTALALILLALGGAEPVCPGPTPWPLLENYQDRFVTDEGRVVEPSAGDRTTSEGQAYALFFSLVANDRAGFDRLLAWTRDNLADGDLTRNLPGWQWGKDDQGAWRLLDRSSASDADLWLAYALIEAGRLWCEPSYTDLARAVLERVVAQELVRLPRLGPMLLPGPVGFEPRKGRLWRLNPSYLPLSLIRRFASEGLPGPWAQLAVSAARLIRDSASHGFVPDWVGYDRDRGVIADPVGGRIGSYDAIRVYLWAGMLPDDEPLRAALRAALAGPRRWLAEHGTLPERLDVGALAERGKAAPPGFYAVLLPGAAGEEKVASAAIARSFKDGLYGEPPAYYDQNLILFGRGFAEGRFRFDGNGALTTGWAGIEKGERRCCARRS